MRASVASLPVHRRLWRRAAIAAALAGTSAPAAAADPPDTSQWKCEKCPFAKGYEAQYQLGGSYATDAAARFGDASGYDEEGGYVEAHGRGRYLSEDYRMDWTLEDLGLDSRFIAIEGDGGVYDYHIAYRQLPHHVFDTAETVYAVAGKDTLVLPDDWVRAPETGGFSALDASLVERDIESERKRLAAGARYRPLQSLEFFFEAYTEEQEGVDITSGSFFTQGNLLPRPFEHRTDSLDLGLNWRGERGFATLAYYGSFFSDEATALVWENPFTGPDRGAFAQPPDNNFQQLTLSGSYRFALDTVVAASAALGRMEQDDDFLAYSIDPALASPLPRATLDGEVDTTNLAVTITSRPLSFARLSAAFRYDERDDGTPVTAWERVLVDAFPSNEAELNVPYSFERMHLDLSADVDLHPTLRVSAGYERTEFERDSSSVAEQTENSGWGRVRWRPNALVDVSARLGAAKREIDRFDASVLVADGQNPLLRKYNLAYRYRDFAEALVTATLPEWPVSISANYLYASDDYSKSVIGLTRSDDQRFAADVSWAASDDIVVYLTGGYEDIEARQASSQSFDLPDWTAVHDDRFYTLGGGVSLNALDDRLEFRLDYTRGEGTSRIEVDGPALAGTGRFPDLETTLDTLRASAGYRVSERLETIVEVRYERFEADDWALEGVEPDTLPTVLTLGAEPYDYDVTVIGLSFRYRFGSRRAQAEPQ